MLKLDINWILALCVVGERSELRCTLVLRLLQQPTSLPWQTITYILRKPVIDLTIYCLPGQP